jgi:hypothetical protein
MDTKRQSKRRFQKYKLTISQGKCIGEKGLSYLSLVEAHNTLQTNKMKP